MSRYVRVVVRFIYLKINPLRKKFGSKYVTACFVVTYIAEKIAGDPPPQPSRTRARIHAITRSVGRLVGRSVHQSVVRSVSAATTAADSRRNRQTRIRPRRRVSSRNTPARAFNQYPRGGPPGRRRCRRLSSGGPGAFFRLALPASVIVRTRATPSSSSPNSISRRQVH